MYRDIDDVNICVNSFWPWKVAAQFTFSATPSSVYPETDDENKKKLIIQWGREEEREERLERGEWDGVNGADEVVRVREKQKLANKK